MTLRQSLLLFLLAPIVICAQPRKPAGQPKKQTASPQYVARWVRQASGVADNMCSVFFLDTQLGWAAGENNTVLKTTDGGATWKRLTDRKDSGRCAEVAFSDASNGWLNNGDVLLYTSDGGDTWRPAEALGQSGGFGAGCVVGSARYQLHTPNMGVGVFRSDDGGRTWVPLPGKLERNSYRAISFSDPQHGWLLSQPDTISLTTDAGRTWTDVVQKISQRQVKVKFADALNGWAFGLDGTTMLGSTDGGKTWTGEYTGLKSYDALDDMDFRDTKNGFVLSVNGQVIATTDGGRHWHQIGALARGIRGLSFPDPSHGWVVGDKGYLMHYYLVKVGAH
jgi:photosystem II stability/assembly factor-like uncharacterized protein